MPGNQFLIRRRDRQVDDTSLERDGLTIGRLPGNDLVLNHRAVAPTLAGVREIEGHYWVVDLSGSNGIIVNQRLVTQKRIGEGDVLQAGPYLLRFSPQATGLEITVEVGVGLRLLPEAATRVDAAAVADADEVGQATLDVFWDKRKRESGRIAEASKLNPASKGRLGKALVGWAPTLDLRDPWRAAYFVWGAGVVIVATVLALVAYRDAFSPGRLATPHAVAQPGKASSAAHGFGGSCTACHGLITSIDRRCADCHQTPQFLPTVSTAHAQAGVGCTACHREHGGDSASLALLRTEVCQDCHGRQPIPRGVRAGQTLGAPHADAVSRDAGYPVKDGVWKWRGLAAAEWTARGLPVLWAARPPTDQFHAMHHAVRGDAASTSRMACSTCHGPGNPAKADQPVGFRTACAQCHAPASAEAPNCVSCHPPHAQSRWAKSALAAVSFDYSGLNQVPLVSDSAKSDRPPATPPSEVGGLGGPAWLMLALALVAAAMLGLMGAIRSARARWQRRAQAQLADSATPVPPLPAGPGYPHPVINASLCIGCHACVDACPHDVLDIVNGVATPVALDQCMEDTSCMAECPTNPKACFVVNTTKVIPPRKVPQRGQTYETNVPGLYLIGDVSGVPLIKNAINEGAQVIGAVAEDLRADSANTGADFDVAIIGVGPAGFSAALAAQQAGLRHVAIEQSQLASTLRGYPAGKYIFFKPETVALQGLVPLPGVGGRKEELLSSWEPLSLRLNLHEGERCRAVQRLDGSFEIQTEGTESAQRHSYRARRVIVSIGNSGSPMKLGVKGEDLKIGGQPKVRYQLSDPKEFAGQKCIVVGAGNSAIEAAVDLTGFERNGDGFTFRYNTEVALVVRSDFKGDLKLGNKMNIYDCLDAGRVKVFFETTIGEITPEAVTLVAARGGKEKARLSNDFIFALIGSERPTKFLESLGVRIG